MNSWGAKKTQKKGKKKNEKKNKENDKKITHIFWTDLSILFNQLFKSFFRPYVRGYYCPLVKSFYSMIVQHDTIDENVPFCSLSNIPNSDPLTDFM